jgi:hypothetical protein
MTVVMQQVPTCLQVPWRQSNKIFSTNGTSLITIVSAGTTNGNTAPTKVFSVIASNNDTIAHDVSIGITDSTSLYTNLGTVTLPINAGYVGNIPSVNLLNAITTLPLDETGQSYCFLNPGDSLQASVRVAVNTGHDIDIVAFGADF